MNDKDQGREKSPLPIEERMSILETAFDTSKSDLGIIGIASGLVIGLIGIALAWNITSERSELKDSAKEMKADVDVRLKQMNDDIEKRLNQMSGDIDKRLNELKDAPQIELLTADKREPLDGAVVLPYLVKDGNFIVVKTDIIMTNSGKGWTDEKVAIRIYTPEALGGSGSKSPDERAYSFENSVIGGTKENGLEKIPAGWSTNQTLNLAYFDAATFKKIAPADYPILFKFYYGGNRIAKAAFTARFKEGVNTNL